MSVSFSRRLIDTLLDILTVITEAFISPAVLGAYSKPVVYSMYNGKNGVE
jgi:hypothetical protein